MDSSTLPIKPTMHDANTNAYDMASKSISQNTVPNSETEHASADNENSTQTIDPNAIILAEALTDKAISWQIHNCKIIKKTVTQDLPLPFCIITTA